MGRILWIAGAVIFTSLLLYLGYVGHRKAVDGYAANATRALGGLSDSIEKYATHILPEEKSPPVRLAQKNKVTPAPVDDQKPVGAIPPKSLTPATKPENTTPSIVAPKSVVASSVDLLSADYNDVGQMILTGKATPGAEVEFRIDGKIVEKQIISANGDWQLTVPHKVSSGQHRLQAAFLVKGEQPGTITVLPFVKAGPDEIAAMTAFKKVIALQRVKTRTQAPRAVASSRTVVKPPQTKDAKSVLQTKKRPSRSKLAELARATPIQTDARPLTRLPPVIDAQFGPVTVVPKINTPEPVSQPVKTNIEGVPVVGASEPKRLKAAESDPNALERLPRVGIPSKIAKAPSGTPENAKPSPKEQTSKITIKSGKIAKTAERGANNARSDEKPDFYRSEPGGTGEGASPDHVVFNIYGREISVPMDSGVFVVQPGNTLWDLAISIYGSGRHYSKLLRANRDEIGRSGMIYPGQIIFAPGANPPLSITPNSPPQWFPPSKN